MFKFLLIALCFFTVLSSVDPSPALVQCLQDRCTDQYNKCQNTSGCDAKMTKCVDKCGEKVNQTCWTFCIGTPGAAANLATCAVNQKCIVGADIFDLVKEFLEAVTTD
jgi:hypothetical protein